MIREITLAALGRWIGPQSIRLTAVEAFDNLFSLYVAGKEHGIMADLTRSARFTRSAAILSCALHIANARAFFDGFDTSANVFLRALLSIFRNYVHRGHFHGTFVATEPLWRNKLAAAGYGPVGTDFLGLPGAHLYRQA